MTNIKNCEKFDRIDNQIWKKSKIDNKGRCVLPQKLRKKLGLATNSTILWISINRKINHNNEFIIEIGVKQ